MLERGQKVNLTYYHGEGQIHSPGCIVEEYDNGLLKVSSPIEPIRFVLKKADGTEETQSEWNPKPEIFNLRSIGFLKVELAE